MRMLRPLVGATALAVVALLSVPAAATAAGKGSTPTEGTFGGQIGYVGCDAPASHVASGTWSVVQHGMTAKATFDLLVDGQPHVAYTYPGMKRVDVAGTEFTAAGITQAGPLTITLYDSGVFTYVISPYSYEGLTCQAVTFYGLAA